jgi:hypothetical protein
MCGTSSIIFVALASFFFGVAMGENLIGKH